MTARHDSDPGADPDLPALLPGLLRNDEPTSSSSAAASRSPRDWFVDLVAILIAAAVGLIGFAETVPDSGVDSTRALDLVVGAVACLSLWWRRRWPVELGVGVAAVSVFAASAGGPTLVLLFTVAVHRRFTVTAVVAAVHFAAAVAYYGVYPDPELSWRGTTIFSAMFVVTITAWGMFVRARRQLVLSLRERTHQAESEAALRVEQARHRERERIAREMHDVLAHRISLLSVHAGALEYRPDAPRADVAKAASVIRSSAHQALQDLREIIGVLRAPSADDPDRPQPTLDDIAALVSESEQAGMRVAATEDYPRDTSPPPAVARCAYRVVQEGLTNARKHADGTGVRVRVTGSQDNGLDVEVTNRPPVGPTSPHVIPGAGTGLIGLAERVDLLGGRLEHGWTPDDDFRVHAWLPWPA